tara:strand:+ start:110961 stop:112187 length:1227 start_codon:yes stop_codon:yes gene_type:complete
MSYKEQPYSVMPDLTDPSLVGAWLNKETRYTAKDASNKGNDGTNTDVSYLKNGGKFNGVDSRIVLSGGFNLINSSDNFSIFATFSTNVLDSSRRAAVSGGSTTIQLGKKDNDKLLFRFVSVDTDVIELESNSSMIVGQLYRAAITYDYVNVKLYVDGIFQSSSPMAKDNQGSTPWAIGKHISANQNEWVGPIKDVEFYNEAKDESWIREDYLKRVPDPSLLLWLPHGDKDYSRYQRTLTNTNTIVGNKMTFNGTDSKIDTGSDFIGVGDISMSCWININSFGEGSNGRIIDNARFLFVSRGANSSLLVQSDGSTSITSAANSIQANKWIYVAVTRMSSGIVNFYINGVLSGTPNQDSGTPISVANVNIGNTTGQDSTLDGKISDLRIYDEIKSPEFIKNLYVSTRKNY